ncbi:MAG: SMI1/KNR4 family protein [Gemmataceae bacterium]|nr:SMI1/KNR4 family protein [Gemmataceae bacterium]
MLDYAKWVERAVAFVQGMPSLPGEVNIETHVAPPLTKLEVEKLAKWCKLPIPEPLRRFWLEGSGHCHCTYSWSIPNEFHQQFSVAFPEVKYDWLRGGAQFLSAPALLDATEWRLGWVEGFRDESPKDARFWAHSVPFHPVGNGDYVALYVRDNVDDPPVAYLNHEGCGCSEIIANSFDEFLQIWEALAYLDMDFLYFFRNSQNERFEPSAFLVESEAVQALFRAEVRTDLVKPARAAFTEADWVSTNDPDKVLNWLKENEKLDERKLRLFGCACCRRIWDRLGELSRETVALAEEHADGAVSQADFEFGRSELIQWEGRDSTKYGIALSALDGGWYTSWEIGCRLDEPELSQAKAAHADLLRHIFGNPFRPLEMPGVRQTEIVRRARALYDGHCTAAELREALAAAGFAELAEHFERPDHPKGCWALDLLI